MTNWKARKRWFHIAKMKRREAIIYGEYKEEKDNKIEEYIIYYPKASELITVHSKKALKGFILRKIAERKPTLESEGYKLSSCQIKRAKDSLLLRDRLKGCIADTPCIRVSVKYCFTHALRFMEREEERIIDNLLYYIDNSVEW